MPQAAQQDYIRIVPKVAENFSADAYALAEAKSKLLLGTIYDCIIVTYTNGVDELRSRPIADERDGIYFYDPDESAVSYVEIPYTIEQYEGMGAVQQALWDADKEQSSLPVLEEVGSNYLAEEHSGDCHLCDEEGNLVKVTSVDGIIVALERTTTKPEGDDFVKVDFSELLKLIGLPID